MQIRINKYKLDGYIADDPAKPPITVFGETIDEIINEMDRSVKLYVKKFK